MSVLTTSFPQQFQKSPPPTLSKVVAVAAKAKKTNLYSKWLKCGHFTISFHHSIPVEHSTDSVPSLASYLASLLQSPTGLDNNILRCGQIIPDHAQPCPTHDPGSPPSYFYSVKGWGEPGLRLSVRSFHLRGKCCPVDFL